MMRNITITLFLISYSEWVILICYDTLLTSNMCVMLQPSLTPSLLEEVKHTEDKVNFYRCDLWSASASEHVRICSSPLGFYTSLHEGREWL